MLPTPDNAPYSGPVLSEEDKRVGEAVSVKEARQAELDEVIRMGTNIEQLIQELCPDGVPYRPLGELGIFVRGAGIQKSDLQSEGHPAIHYGQIHTYYGLSCFQTVSFISPEKAEKAKKAEPGDLVIVTTSEDTSAVAKAVAWEGESEVAVSGDALIFKHSLVNKYLSYVFQSGVFQSAKDRLVNGTKVRRVSPKDLGRIQVPVPPVEVQEEIVRILDLFTTLEAELEAELEKRVAQYAYYRNALFKYESGDVAWIPLGELAQLDYGFTARASSVGQYRFLRITDINSFGKFSGGNKVYVSADVDLGRYVVMPGDVLMARTGATYGKSAYYDLPEPSVYASFLIRIRVVSRALMSKFYWYFAQTTYYWEQVEKLVLSAAQPQFNANKLARILVPVPPIEEQRRIAGILDQMDALVNDLSSGLPAEIAARRKQYEYYRDRLLSFPELTEPAAMASPNTQEPTRA